MPTHGPEDICKAQEMRREHQDMLQGSMEVSRETQTHIGGDFQDASAPDM